MFAFKLGRKSDSLFISLIAIMLIAFGLLRISLGFIGGRDTALITGTRRQSGERNEAVPNRYTYSISYTFTTVDGQKIDGFTYKTDSAVYIKNSGPKPAMIQVRYLKAIPYFNALESDAGLNAGNVVLALAGLLLLRFDKPRKRVHRLQRRGTKRK